MRLLYRRSYPASYDFVSSQIQSGAEVLDICCGDGLIGWKLLKPRGIHYHGIDFNPAFIHAARKHGLTVDLLNVKKITQLPPSQITIMLLSLYYFIPDVDTIMRHLIDSATEQLIIAESIQHTAQAGNPLVRSLASHLNVTFDDAGRDRFSHTTLMALFQRYQASQIIDCGRELIGIWKKSPTT